GAADDTANEDAAGNRGCIAYRLLGAAALGSGTGCGLADEGFPAARSGEQFDGMDGPRDQCVDAAMAAYGHAVSEDVRPRGAAEYAAGGGDDSAGRGGRAVD